MVPYWLAFLALLVFLALFPPTAPWSDRFLTPLVALGSGVYLLWRRQGPWGLGLGNLGWSLAELSSLPRGLYLEFPYLLGYAALAWGLLRFRGKPPRLSLGLLPLSLLGALTLLELELGLDRLYTTLDALLLLLLLPRLEPLFTERFLPGRPFGGCSCRR